MAKEPAHGPSEVPTCTHTHTHMYTRTLCKGKGFGGLFYCYGLANSGFGGHQQAEDRKMRR